MSSGAPVTLLALTLVCLSAVAVGGVATADTGVSQQVSGGETPQSNTTFLVELQLNGDARWTVSTTFDLDTDNETDGYRDLAMAFVDGETAGLGLQGFQRASEFASESTGRPMEITDVTRRTAPESMVENGTGRLTLSFTWQNFARIDSERLYLGDVFETEEEWLTDLEDDQTLVVRPPDGFYPADANVAPQNRSLRWDGPVTLGPDVLNATFAGTGGATPSTATPTATQTPGGGGSGGESSTGLWAGVLVLGLGFLALAGYLFTRREGLGFPGRQDDDGPTAGTETADVAENGDGVPAGTGDTGTEDIDEELLSDEERVERLLEQNGGRMKQANIVKETGWSNAKVSQLLSSMQEEGRIDKLRIGRENLISFPEEDITDIEE